MTVAALECRGLSVGYTDNSVVRDLDLSVAPGEVLALLGANGAGKSAVLGALAGLLPRHRGEVELAGVPLPPGRPTTAVRAGLVFVPDDRALFASLTVEENLQAARPRRGPATRQMLEIFPALEKRWKVKAGALSGGEQQMLTVARGLIRQPKVLMIDEMSMGLAPIVVGQLLGVVRTIADSTGAAVILVEQHVQLALDIADQVLVLAHGTVAIRGTAAGLRARPDAITAAYFDGAD